MQVRGYERAVHAYLWQLVISLRDDISELPTGDMGGVCHHVDDVVGEVRVELEADLQHDRRNAPEFAGILS